MPPLWNARSQRYGETHFSECIKIEGFSYLKRAPPWKCLGPFRASSCFWKTERRKTKRVARRCLFYADRSAAVPLFVLNDVTADAGLLVYAPAHGSGLIAYCEWLEKARWNSRWWANRCCAGDTKDRGSHFRRVRREGPKGKMESSAKWGEVTKCQGTKDPPKKEERTEGECLTPCK